MRASRPSNLPAPVGSVPRRNALAPGAKIQAQGEHWLSLIRDRVLRAGSVGGEDFRPPPANDRAGGHESEPDTGAARVCGSSQSLAVEERCTGQHQADSRVGFDRADRNPVWGEQRGRIRQRIVPFSETHQAQVPEWRFELARKPVGTRTLPPYSSGARQAALAMMPCAFASSQIPSH